MLIPPHILLAALPCLLAASALLSTAAATAPVDCKICVERIPGGIRLTGQAVSSQKITGRYTLHANKEGPSGSSRLAQGGEFKLDPGALVQLGDVFLGIQQGDIYNARLDLTWAGGGVYSIESGAAKT